MVYCAGKCIGPSFSSYCIFNSPVFTPAAHHANDHNVIAHVKPKFHLAHHDIRFGTGKSRACCDERHARHDKQDLRDATSTSSAIVFLNFICRVMCIKL